MSAAVERACTNCGKAFWRGPSGRVTCSDECATARLRRKGERGNFSKRSVCAVCGKEFNHRMRRSERTPKFCGKTCRRADRSATRLSRRQTRGCEECGTDFNRRNGKRFCSAECRRTNIAARKHADAIRRNVDAFGGVQITCICCRRTVPKLRIIGDRIFVRRELYCSNRCARAMGKKYSPLWSGVEDEKTKRELIETAIQLRAMNRVYNEHFGNGQKVEI